MSENGKRDERCNAYNKPEDEIADCAPSAAPAPMAQDRLRNPTPGVVGQGAFALDQPPRDVTPDGIRHRGHFVRFGEHCPAVTRVLYEPILPFVTAHLDMRNDVNPQARNIALAHAAIEKLHVAWNFIEQRRERIVEQFKPRNVRISQIHDDARSLGRFDARFTNGVFQRLWNLCSLALIFFASPHSHNLATAIRQAKKKSVSFQEV